MSSDGSVTRWLAPLQAGDEEAAQKLWERYFARLVGLARKKLQGTRQVSDEEDVALSAFDSFCRNAQQGRFSHLGDRDNLWRLLVMLTARKACHLLRDAGRQKRGGKASAAAAALEEVVGAEPTPEFAAQVAEEYQRLLASLEDAELESVAVWKMEGFTTDEMAARLKCAPRTVERKLRLIRGIWEKDNMA